MAVSKVIELIFRTKGADKATQKTEKLDTRLVKLGKSAIKAGAAYFGARGLIVAMKTSVNEAIRFELAVAKMNQVMLSMNTFTPEASRVLQGYAASLQEVTLFSNTAILEGMSLLQTYKQIPDDVMPRAIETMLDIATVMDGDLRTAANKVGKAAMGMSGELREAGITVDEEIARHGTFAEILDEVEKQVGGVAKAAGETLAGDLAQAGHAVDDLKREFGLLVSPAVSQVSLALKELARNFRRVLSPERLGTQELREEIASLEAEVETLPKISFTVGGAAAQVGVMQRKKEIEDLRVLLQLALDRENAEKKIIVAARLRDEELERTKDSMNTMAGLTASTATDLAQAAIAGKNLGDVMAQAAVEAIIIAAQTRIVSALLGMGTDSPFATFATKLFGFTGQTPTVNNSININGGLVSDSYVRNTLMPAMNRVRSLG